MENMPENVSPIDAQKSRDHDVPVIVCTGRTPTVTIDKARMALS